MCLEHSLINSKIKAFVVNFSELMFHIVHNYYLKVYHDGYFTDYWNIYAMEHKI